LDALAVATSLANPYVGDVSGSGTGTTIRSAGNPGVATAITDAPSTTLVAAQHHGGPADNAVVAWVAVAVLLIGLKFAAEHGTEEKEFSSVRIGFWNFVAITIVAILGINAAKWFAGTWQIPGISTLVLAS
jgi:hypothetical protein